MPEDQTIIDAAAQALKAIGRPATIAEIFDEIQAKSLYEFNTPTPEHVLRTQIRRATTGVDRDDATKTKVFIEVEPKTYDLIPGSSTKAYQPGMRRLYRATDKEPVIQVLMDERLGVFREIWRLLFFAATLGFRHNRRRPLESVATGKGIDQSTFGNNPAWPGICHLMGLVESESVDCMRASEEAEAARITTFEEYANGGLEILADRFLKMDADLDAFVAFVEEQIETAATSSPDLNSISI